MNLRDELMAIRAEHGALTPASVVDAARAEDHPLHDRFEWDDAVAGEAWRLHQAHRLIVSVKRSVPSDSDGTQTIRNFVAVRGDDPRTYVYDPADEVAQDPLRREMVLREMEREWRTLRRRYEQFAEFVQMVRRDLEAA